jgi:hypothetical protein
VFLNIGTSTEAVARALRHHKNLLVITNNMNIANTLASNSDCEVVVTGGTVRRGDGGLIGTMTVKAIRSFKFDYAVIGCSALDEDGDVLDYDIQEVGRQPGDHRPGPRASACGRPLEAAPLGARAHLFACRSAGRLLGCAASPRACLGLRAVGDRGLRRGHVIPGAVGPQARSGGMIARPAPRPTGQRQRKPRGQAARRAVERQRATGGPGDVRRDRQAEAGARSSARA